MLTCEKTAAATLPAVSSSRTLRFSRESTNYLPSPKTRRTNCTKTLPSSFFTRFISLITVLRFSLGMKLY